MDPIIPAAAGALAVGFAASSASLAAGVAATPLLPAVTTIHIKNFMFVPLTTTIHAGDRVSFVNDDAEAHTATADDKAFDSEGLDSGQTWQHVFDKPGTIRYFCELHPYMKATITVLPAAPNAQR